ncbi:acyltransferase family protein [Streptomyces sp. NBC_00239]|uniref:acyltransferase family protein n=1 Tax=Streptomyces sp. NBC_00239 TaxID=2903640 RepID=UPI002E2DF23F|nr:acyltransferase family protein [Streptomyces sp. NBC_00239]
MGHTASELAAATPDSRDRYVDLLRIASLGTVVLGHWLMAAVTDDGMGNLLAVVPRLQVLTWVLQVMPVFFFVGGFSHALSYRSLARRQPAAGAGAPDEAASAGLYPAFLRARLRRLLRPTLVFVLVWSAAALVVQLAGGGGQGLAAAALRLVTQPLWFIGIYLAMVAFTPPLLRLHDRYGWGVFAALATAAALVDAARFAAGVPYLEFLNFAFVWLAVHQLGFLRADGRIRRPALLAGAGLVAAVLLVRFGPYPLSMVGMPGEKVSNMAPPTLALLAHGLWLVGAVELLRRPAARLLTRPAVWRPVVAANGLAMTAFLWHLTAMLGVYGAQLALGIALPEPASAAWWGQVPVRIVAAAALTAVLVALFRRFEAPAGRAHRPGGPLRPAATAVLASGSGGLAAAGVTLCLLGVLGLSLTGLGGLLEGRTATLIAFPVTAPAAVAMVLAGWAAVERSGSPGRTARRARANRPS